MISWDQVRHLLWGSVLLHGAVLLQGVQPGNGVFVQRRASYVFLFHRRHLPTAPTAASSAAQWDQDSTLLAFARSPLAGRGFAGTRPPCTWLHACLLTAEAFLDSSCPLQTAARCDSYAGCCSQLWAPGLSAERAVELWARAVAGACGLGRRLQLPLLRLSDWPAAVPGMLDALQYVVCRAAVGLKTGVCFPAGAVQQVQVTCFTCTVLQGGGVLSDLDLLLAGHTPGNLLQ